MLGDQLEQDRGGQAGGLNGEQLSDGVEQRTGRRDDLDDPELAILGCQNSADLDGGRGLHHIDDRAAGTAT